jgi:hypothetical protein
LKQQAVSIHYTVGRKKQTVLQPGKEIIQVKISITLAAFSIGSLLSFVVQPAVSQENEKTTISEYCASHGNLGLSHGGCVAYFTTHNVVPHDASVCQNQSMQDLLGVTNHGQCMKKLTDMRK